MFRVFSMAAALKMPKLFDLGECFYSDTEQNSAFSLLTRQTTSFPFVLNPKGPK